MIKNNEDIIIKLDKNSFYQKNIIAKFKPIATEAITKEKQFFKLMNFPSILN